MPTTRSCRGALAIKMNRHSQPAYLCDLMTLPLALNRYSTHLCHALKLGQHQEDALLLKTATLFAAVAAFAIGYAGASSTVAKAADYAVGGYGPHEGCDGCAPPAHLPLRPWHRLERETVIERPAIVEREVIVQRPVIERRVIVERPAIIERRAVVVHRALPRLGVVPGYGCDC